MGPPRFRCATLIFGIYTDIWQFIFFLGTIAQKLTFGLKLPEEDIKYEYFYQNIWQIF